MKHEPVKIEWERGVILGRTLDVLRTLCASRAGLTKDALAESLGVNRRTVSRYLRAIGARLTLERRVLDDGRAVYRLDFDSLARELRGRAA